SKYYFIRNAKIAQECEQLFNIVMKADDDAYCKHCKTSGHLQSDGCWTMKEAEKLGKKTHLVIVDSFRNRKWKSSIGIMDFAGCVSKNTARKIRKFVEETDNAYEDS